MEYVKVTYIRRRTVNIDGDAGGFCGDVIRVDAGTHVFDLGTPSNYTPPSQTVTVQNTTVLQPMVIAFVPAGK